MRANRLHRRCIPRIFSISALVLGLTPVVVSPLANLASVRAANVRGSIKFSYANGPVTAVTQSWVVDQAVVTKAWAIDGALTPRPTFAPDYLATATSKRIPSNAITPAYTDEMAASDELLASIFGGPEAVAAANAFEPRALGSQYPLYRGDLIGDDRRILRGHLSFAMHLYGSEDGIQDTEIYVPAGFISHSTEPTPTDAVLTFYYPRLGNIIDVTVAVFHVANFQLNEENGRVRIGSTGGPGGSIHSYRHSHIEFYRGNTGLPPLAERQKLRIDPVTVFASTTANARAVKWKLDR